MERRVTVALICATVATLVPTSGAAQQLVLTVDVGKTEFFEDEPVYLLARLQNLGPDTAWVYSFGLASVDAFTISARRGDGQEVPVGGVSVNYMCARPGPCRGKPVPPGVNLLSTIALQDIAGDGQNILRHLYAHHLAPDRYELRVEFRARGGALGTTPLAVQAAPIAFRIRTRTAAEEDEVRELETMRQMLLDTTRVAAHPRALGYQAALIHWVERRLSEEPDDPFLPFLLQSGIYMWGKVTEEWVLAGKVPRFDPDTSAMVSRLRLGVIERNKRLPAGAHLVQGMSARHRGEFQPLAERLGPSPAADMARYQIWLGPYWP